MRVEDSVVSNDGGRLILEDRDERTKTEYAGGNEDYAEGFVDYHKGAESEQRRMEEAADYNG